MQQRRIRTNTGGLERIKHLNRILMHERRRRTQGGQTGDYEGEYCFYLKKKSRL